MDDGLSISRTGKQLQRLPFGQKSQRRICPLFDVFNTGDWFLKRLYTKFGKRKRGFPHSSRFADAACLLLASKLLWIESTIVDRFV